MQPRSEEGMNPDRSHPPPSLPPPAPSCLDPSTHLEFLLHLILPLFPLLLLLLLPLLFLLQLLLFLLQPLLFSLLQLFLVRPVRDRFLVVPEDKRTKRSSSREKRQDWKPLWSQKPALPHKQARPGFLLHLRLHLNQEPRGWLDSKWKEVRIKVKQSKSYRAACWFLWSLNIWICGYKPWKRSKLVQSNKHFSVKIKCLTLRMKNVQASTQML